MSYELLLVPVTSFHATETAIHLVFLTPWSLALSGFSRTMPRTKQRSVRRVKRKPPSKASPRLPTSSVSPTTSTPIRGSDGPDTTRTPGCTSPIPTSTASERKLSESPHSISENPSSSSSSESESECDSEVRKGARILEVAGIQTALKAVNCKECGSGPVSFEDLSNREGLCTRPYLFCQNYQTRSEIPFEKAGPKTLAVNRKAVLANKCVGDSYTSLETLFALLDLPPPVSQRAYGQHMKVVATGAAAEVEHSMKRARMKICDLYDTSPEETIDILISCDGTWQKRGFSSLFGAVFIIAYETGKVLDYIVLSTHCTGCKRGKTKTRRQ